MKIQFDANGDLIESSIDDNGDTVDYVQGEGVTTTHSTIGDPNAPVPYTDEQLAEALTHTQAIGSIEQAELDSLRSREQWLLDKANAVTGWNADKTPRYVETESERARLLRAAKGVRDALPFELIMANRRIATRFLDAQLKVVNAQQTLADHAALEQRAREIAFETDAKELADLFKKRKISGERN
jgi:hypothetical protein